MGQLKLPFYEDCVANGVTLSGEQQQDYEKAKLSKEAHCRAQQNYNQRMTTDPNTGSAYKKKRTFQNVTSARQPEQRARQRFRNITNSSTVSVPTNTENTKVTPSSSTATTEKKKKAGGKINNYSPSKFVFYPPWFHAILSEVLPYFIDYHGEETIPWDAIAAVFNLFLKRHFHEMQSTQGIQRQRNANAEKKLVALDDLSEWIRYVDTTDTMGNKKIRYLKCEYRRAAAKNLTPPTTGQVWTVKPKFLATSSERKERLKARTQLEQQQLHLHFKTNPPQKTTQHLRQEMYHPHFLARFDTHCPTSKTRELTFRSTSTSNNNDDTATE